MDNRNRKSLSILSWNACSLPAHIDQLRDFLARNSYDIILVQEVRSQTVNKLKIPNYRVYISPRYVDGAPNPYGGTAIYIKTCIPHSPCQRLNLRAIDASIVKIYPCKDFNFSIASIYVRLNMPPAAVKSDLSKVFNSDSAVFGAGDFNAHHVRWNSYQTTNYGEAVNDLCISNDYTIAFPHSPTRFGTHSVIDFGILKNIPYHYHVEALDELPSDHKPISFTLSTPSNIPSILHPPVVNWSIYTDTILNSPPPFTDINDTNDVDNAAKNLTNTLRHALNSATSHPPKVTSYNKFPHELHDKIKLKNYVRKLWSRTKDPALKIYLNTLVNEIKREVKKFRNDKWENFISNLAPSDHSLWDYLKKVKNPFTPTPPLSTGQTTAHTDVDKAEALAAHFASQFSPHRDVFCAETTDIVYDAVATFERRTPHTPIEPTDAHEIIVAIQNLPNRKAPGYDGLNNNALKNLPIHYAELIAVLINKMFEFHHFPKIWKHAIIVPIHKPGSNPSLPQNHRPISLLASLSKLVEHIFFRRIDTFLTDKEILIPEQFGFRKSHSTTHQLLRVTEYISNGLGNKRHTGAVFLDIAKAFDTVWHPGLIFKLIRIGMPTAFIRLIQSYLRDRSFSVKYATSISSIHPIHAGVPQGSKISPILFELYVNDIPRHPSTALALYADDTAILASSKKIALMNSHLQQHLYLLEDWFTKWRIKVNASKSQAVFFSRSFLIAPPPLHLNGTHIAYSREAKYLGVILDRRLTWKSHFSYAIQKTHFAVNSISSLIYNPNLSIDNKILLYKTVIRPILLYAAPVWGCAAPSNLQKLQTVQNKTLRKIRRADWYHRNSRIHSDFRIYPIRHEIQKLATNFYNNIHSIQNELLFNLPVYDPWEFPTRPRASMAIKTGLTPKDDNFVFL